MRTNGTVLTICVVINVVLFGRRRNRNDGHGAELSIDVKIWETVKCRICGKLLRITLKMVVKPLNRTFFRDVDLEEIKHVDYMIVYKPFPYPPDTYRMPLCKRCHDLLMEEIRRFIDDMRKRANAYEIASCQTTDHVIEFETLHEMKRFVDEQVLWHSIPRLEWISDRSAGFACGRKVYALTMIAATRGNEKDKPHVVLAYVPITKIADGLKGA